MLSSHVVRTSCALTAALAIAGCSGGGSSVTAPFDQSTSAISNNTTIPNNTTTGSAASSQIRSALSTAKAATITELPRSSDAFVDSVGINTHFHFMGTPYVDSYPAVRDLLFGLGVRHLRDSMALDLWQPYFDHLSEIAAHGIHADLITQMNEPLAQITSFPSHAPNVLEAIEAPNEMDLSGDGNWVADTQKYQKVLYAGVKSSAPTANLLVYGPSLCRYEDYASVGNLAAYADQGNMHDYFAANNPGTAGGTPFPVGNYGSLPFFIGSAQLVTGSKPIATTETGYEDNPVNPSVVSPAVKARYSMRTLLEQWNMHVSRTYFYELVDEGNQSYGVISPTLAPKPVYFALQNLLQKLNDGSAPINLQALTYSMTADPIVHHTLLQKHDGSYRLMLWVETLAVDPAVPSRPVTITTTTKFATVAQYQWLDDGQVQTIPLKQAADGTISLTVTDRVTELKLQK